MFLKTKMSVEKENKCNGSIFIQRRALHYIMIWFGWRKPKKSLYTFFIEKEDPFWLTKEQGTPELEARKYSLRTSDESKGKISELNKLDYIVLKYLLKRYRGSFVDQSKPMSTEGGSSIYLDWDDLYFALNDEKYAPGSFKGKVKTSLKKLSAYKFEFSMKNVHRAFIQSWSIETIDGMEVFKISLNPEAFFPILDVQEPICTKTKPNTCVLYPVNTILRLYNKSKSVHYFITIDKILTLPGQYDKDGNFRTTWASPEYLWSNRAKNITKEEKWQLLVNVFISLSELDLLEIALADEKGSPISYTITTTERIVKGLNENGLEGEFDLHRCYFCFTVTRKFFDDIPRF